jgi:HrpA-like RNA helicase
VVDPGVDRELVYDQRYRVSSRKLVSISQSSAKQRAGRAGRTSHGYCFRLYSELELSKFRINKTPEIDNMALDTLVLRLKSLSVDNIFTFPYVKAPDQKALEQSVETLQMIGGLSESSEITTVGRLLLRLHVEPFLGRSIVEAIVCDHIIQNTSFLSSEPCFKQW